MNGFRRKALELEVQRLRELTIRQAEQIRDLERRKNLWLKVAVQLAQQQRKTKGE